MVEPQDSPGEGGTASAYFAQAIAQIETCIGQFLAANQANEQNALQAVELLLKLTSNITKSPSESKFRTIRATIPKIASTLFALPGSPADIVTALGFMKLDEEHYVFVGDYLKVLKKGMVIIENAVEPIKVKFMTPEERMTWEHNQQSIRIYQQEKAAHAEQQKQKKAYMA